MSDHKPRDAYRDGFPLVPVFIIAGIIISAGLAVIVIATQHLWFFADTQNIKHQISNSALQASGQASVNKNSFNYNQGYSDALSSAWSTMHSDQSALAQEPPYAQPDTKAAVLSDGQQVCYDYAQINQAVIPSPPGIVTWVRVNCDGTDVSMTSSLRK